MSEIRITELAKITGFPPTTIRFYENSGLLPPAARAPRGHRVYSDRDVGRLRFIAGAKHLGLTLDEVREIIAVLNGGEDEQNRDRLAATLLARITDVSRRITELSNFSAQLTEALESVQHRAIDPGHNPSDSVDQELGSAPIPPEDDRIRSKAWASVLTRIHSREQSTGMLTLTFPADSALASALAELIAHKHLRSRSGDITLRYTEDATTLEAATADAATGGRDAPADVE